MIKILQVVEMLSENSGVSAVVLNYYNNMNRDLIRFDFLVHCEVRQDIKDRLEAEGSKVYKMPELNAKNISIYIKELTMFFNEHKDEYQMIHGHLPNAAMFYLAVAKKFGIKRRVLHSHSSKGADTFIKCVRNYVMNKVGIKYATDYFACSYNAADYLFGKRNKNVKIIKNAVDIDKFKYNEIKRNEIRFKYGFEDKIVIGHIGRFAYTKNHNFIIDIANKLNDDKYVFMLLGEGELKNAIENKVKKMGLADKVIFVGSVDDPETYYQAMDVFVLPSLYEGLPVVAIEAQISGLKCILSDKITKDVIITNNVKQLEIDDPKLWSEEIKKTEYNERRVEISRIERAGYSIKKESKHLEEIYLQMAN